MAWLECQGSRAMSTTRQGPGLAGEAVHQGFALRIGRKEALDPELLQRDVVGDAEAGHDAGGQGMGAPGTGGPQGAGRPAGPPQRRVSYVTTVEVLAP